MPTPDPDLYPSDPAGFLKSCGIRPTTYALRVLNGSAALSGADLAGKARHYGASYARTRRRVVRAATEYLDCTLRRDKRTGRLSLDFGDGTNPPALSDGAEPCPCALGIDAWTY